MSKARGLADLGNAYNDGALSNRNLIINGAMQVAQRGTSFTSQTGSGYFIDRFGVVQADDATWTYSQEADAPDGFASSFKSLVTTADGSNDASDYQFIRTSLEGQDLQQVKKGTSDAESLTLSFWVKCSGTGTFIAELNDADNNRTISKAYTINSAGTWEYKTVTFEGDTTGTLDNDNAESLRVHWWYGAGSDYTSGTLATSWQSRTNANRAVGSSVNIPTTSGGYFQITGVQLEVGDTATPFEHRSYGDELARCQRYYQKIGYDGGTNVFAAGSWYNSSTAFGYMSLLQTMRTAPTITAPTASNGYKCYSGSGAALASTLSFARVSNKTARVSIAASGGTTGRGAWFELNGVSPCNIIMDAEL